MRRIIYITSILFIFLFINKSSSAQCMEFSKFECMSELEPYIYNGQYNAVTLAEGDVAELNLTFYSGQDYRIFVCCQDMLKKVEFKLYDIERNLIYTSADHNYTEIWDFIASSTQQLIIEVIVHKTSTGANLQSGCVSIIVGFKESE